MPPLATRPVRADAGTVCRHHERAPKNRQARPKLGSCPALSRRAALQPPARLPHPRAPRGATRRHSARSRPAEAARGARSVAASRKPGRSDPAADRRAVGRGAARDRTRRATGLRCRPPQGARRRAHDVGHEGARLSTGRRGREHSTSTASIGSVTRPERPTIRSDERRCCAKAWRSGATLRSASSMPSRSRRSRPTSWRSGGSPRSRSGSTPISRWAAMPTVVSELDALVARAPLPRALPRAADGCALPIRPPGRRPGCVPRRARGVRDEASDSSRGRSSRRSSVPCSSRIPRSTRRPAPSRTGRHHRPSGEGPAGDASRRSRRSSGSSRSRSSAVVAFTRDDGSRIVVPPNSVAVVDPATNDVVAAIQVGIRPGPITAGDGALWVGNLDDRNADANRCAIAAAGRDGLARRAHADGADVRPGEPSGWHTGCSGASALGSIAQFGQRVASVTPVTRRGVYSSAGSVAAGGGAIWAAFGDATLARLDRANGRCRRADHDRRLTCRASTAGYGSDLDRERLPVERPALQSALTCGGRQVDRQQPPECDRRGLR